LKKLILLLAVFCFTAIDAQYNPSAPWMRELNASKKKSNSKVTFQEVVDAFNTYWETRDRNQKGSGYKPFKRWEYYWKNFIKDDGTLPTQQELWNIYLEKQNWESNKSTLSDNSNWQPQGPFTHTNTGSWSSGQGRINCIIEDPNIPTTLYCGAPSGGLWKSTDDGNTWNILTDDLPQIGVSGIAIDYSNSNIIYMATGDDDGFDSYSVGVWKSEDGGITWNPTALNPGNSPQQMNDIYIHPTNSNILWVATTDGVYKTTNAGVSWTNTLPAIDGIDDIKLKPGNPNMIYAVSKSDFFKSTDGGSTFNKMEGSGLPISSFRLVIDVTPANPNLVYVFSATSIVAPTGGWKFQGIYRSTDSGATFTTMATPETVGDVFDGSQQAYFDMAMAVSDTNADEIYTGVLNIWKSIDGGHSMTKINDWSSPSTPSYTHADIHFLRFFNGQLFAGTDGGFYRSDDGGSNFSDLTGGMQIGQFYKIAVSMESSAKMMGGLQDNGGFALNNGQWQNYFGSDGTEAAINPINSNIYYGFTQHGGSLYISDDAGASLTKYITGPETGRWVTPLAVDRQGKVYAGYRSLFELCGSRFKAVSKEFKYDGLDVLEIDDNNPEIIYVAENSVSLLSLLYKSTNSGLSFSKLESINPFISPNAEITSIEVNKSNSDIIYVTISELSSEKGSMDNVGKVLKSNDGGLTFSDITGSLPPVTKNIIKHQIFIVKILYIWAQI
jgi:photosystem II stability/assembly factor-like uncharacterized protein